MAQYYTLEGGQYVEASAPIRWEPEDDPRDLRFGSRRVATVMKEPDWAVVADCHYMPHIREQFATKEEAMGAAENAFNQFWRGEL